MTEVHDGSPAAQPTLVRAKGQRGKSGVCPLCQHAHPSDTLKRMMRDGHRDDAMLVVADLDLDVGKRYRAPVDTDLDAITGVAGVHGVRNSVWYGSTRRADRAD